MVVGQHAVSLVQVGVIDTGAALSLQPLARNWYSTTKQTVGKPTESRMLHRAGLALLWNIFNIYRAFQNCLNQ
jgi:hypothetical protein